ncbi:MAG: 2,5-diamino-6-(ribosylamino)-4(3H)-pyrimidinone 5'-phosphate reductase [bacterium]|nr:2,5-diamino-6-(ribosylamino)-4(3H)-pyrimidinone 5'-phosphate reductase [bacterium]
MDRPFVYINMATTVDGKITSSAREYPRFASAADRRSMDRLRAEADALIVGAGTLRADNPKLCVRDDEMQEYRRSLGKPDDLLKVVVTAGAALPPDSRFFDDADGPRRIVATTETAPAERVDALENLAEVWRLGRETVDLTSLLQQLGARGVERVLLEGGGALNQAFLRADLVDELNLTISPALLGGRDAPTAFEGEGFAMKQQKRLRLADLRREGDELFCRYEVLRDG